MQESILPCFLRNTTGKYSTQLVLIVVKSLGHQHSIQTSMFNLFTSISSTFLCTHGFGFPVSFLCAFLICFPAWFSFSCPLRITSAFFLQHREGQTCSYIIYSLMTAAEQYFSDLIAFSTFSLQNTFRLYSPVRRWQNPWRTPVAEYLQETTLILSHPNRAWTPLGPCLSLLKQILAFDSHTGATEMANT